MFMLSVKAVYDGINLQLFENVKIEKPQQVIITFLGHQAVANDAISNSEIQQIISTSPSLDFLNNDAEDIYTDANLKIRY